MPTTVGLQSTEAGVAAAAAELAHDCVAAYSQAAQRTRAPNVKKAFAAMAQDSQEQLGRWQSHLTSLNHAPAPPNRISQPLNRWKVIAASYLGDKQVAWCTKNNAADRVQAYERVRRLEKFGPTLQDVAKPMIGIASQDLKTTCAIAAGGLQS